MYKKSKRDYEDWEPWAKRIVWALFLLVLAFLIYWVVARVWRNLSSIKHTYTKAVNMSCRPQPGNSPLPNPIILPPHT